MCAFIRGLCLYLWFLVCVCRFLNGFFSHVKQLESKSFCQWVDVRMLAFIPSPAHQSFSFWLLFSGKGWWWGWGHIGPILEPAQHFLFHEADCTQNKPMSLSALILCSWLCSGTTMYFFTCHMFLLNQRAKNWTNMLLHTFLLFVVTEVLNHLRYFYSNTCVCYSQICSKRFKSD